VRGEQERGHGARHRMAGRVCSAKKSTPLLRALAAPDATIGFVLPNPAQPRDGRDGDPRVAAPPRGGHAIQRIERLDGRLAPRQRAPFVAIEPHQARRDVVLAKTLGHYAQAHAPHPQHVRLRLGDAERGGASRLVRALAGNPSRQFRDLGRKRRVGEHRQAQPMAQRIARHHGLAGARARAGAARRVGAIGGEDRLAGHAGSPSGTSVNSPSSTGGAAARSASCAAARSRPATRRFSIRSSAAARRTSAAASMRSIRSN